MTEVKTDALTEDSTRLNRALGNAEKALCDLNIGVEVNVTMSNKMRLYFSRDPDTRKWGLFIRYEKDSTTAPKYISIHDAARDVRALAANYLDQIHQQLLMAAAKLQATVYEAANTAEDFVSKMQAQHGVKK